MVKFATFQHSNLLPLTAAPALGAHLHRVKLGTKNRITYETRLVRSNLYETKSNCGPFSSFPCYFCEKR